MNGSADWGISDPLSLVKVADFLHVDGHAAATVAALVYGNPRAFYGTSPHWQPELNLEPVDPRQFQR